MPKLPYLSRPLVSTRLLVTLLLTVLLPVPLIALAHEAHEAHVPSAPKPDLRTQPTEAPPTQQAWGVAAQAHQVRRTLTLTLNDRLRITPARITVREGESVRLRVRNTGKLPHEVVLGTPSELQAHAEMMRKHPGMEHDEAHMVHVAPGKTGEILWTFNRAGTFEYACLIDGHYQAGMKGVVQVQARPATVGTSAHTHPGSTPIESPAASPGAEHPAMHSGAAPHAHHSAHHAAHHANPTTGQPSMSHGSAAGNTSPYAGGPAREIKALSAQDLAAYTQGQGHRLALAAELNSYPGPVHVLALADALELSPTQRSQSEALLARHQAQARVLGAALIEAERALDRAFATRNIEAESLQRLTLQAAQQLGALRVEHLQAHLAQTALLTPAQIRRYDELRGYTPGAATAPPPASAPLPPVAPAAHH